ncbi:molybdate ABC transporter permease subunit [Arenimonas caeni]|jgi:molybdate transport system permease protein|uniref:Molybdenum transport system permease n=1 Tax=Arenimonas caeni TaxID=2058085 RepID=A0A2P6MCM3_9GAMM|nr:molybdate ABC transporter permease subunit [Arenimonas caeni]MDY0023198.1 molybdate ABC transporter permease subunit [Arenimonas caeni]PRH83748.1 molybdate ABC transporter permease subunit [Arenimonas caeni]
MFSEAEWTIIGLSLRVAMLSTLLSLPFALATAYVLARWRFPGKALFDALVHLPLLLPPVLTGYWLLLLFGRQGPVGRVLEQGFGLVLAFDWTGAVLAAAVMAFPLYVRAIRLSIEAIPREIDEMAASVGARPWATFLHVVLPLSRPGILAGMALAFAKALGEFGATITFVANIPGRTQTLSLAMHGLLQVPGGEAGILRLAVVSVLLALGALLASEWMVRRSPYRRASE